MGLQGPTLAPNHQGYQDSIHETGQWSLFRLPKRTKFQGHWLPTSTPSNESPQRGWMCNNHIQWPLHCGTLLIRAIPPMQNWYCLLEQAYIILNLFRPLRLNPKILTYFELNGTLDYSRTPPSPMHLNPSARQTRTTGALVHHTTKKGGMYVWIWYIIDVLHHRYTRQHWNEYPTWQNSSQSRRNSQDFWQYMR